MEYVKTVVFDFDGVINSYESGWSGEDVIPDPPVEGIAEVINSLRSDGYRVVVVSTRCKTCDGIKAVISYLRKNEIEVDNVMAEKPPAVCYVDDRAICFNGDTKGLIEKIKNFKSWVEKDAPKNEPASRLRPCAAGFWDKGKYNEVTGRFHCWGNNYEEFESGPGNFSVAIVELDDGRVVTCPADTVKFLDR